jgi:ABC-2 type transport system permease protein
METIYILWLRQIKRHFRSKSRLIGSLAQPLLFLIALGYGLGPVFQKAGEGNYINFLAPGIIGMSIIFSATFSGIEIIWDRQFGFLKVTLAAPISRFKIMLGRTLGGATVATFQGITVLIISIISGFRPTNYSSIFFSLLIMFLIALLFTAMGTTIASVMEDIQGFHLIMNFFVMPLFFFSGALFPLDKAPKIISIATRFNPLTYGVDALRNILNQVSNFGLVTDLSMLSIITFIFLLIGTYSFSKIQI